MTASLGLWGCGVAEPTPVAESAAELTYGTNIFYDKFDFYPVGSINGRGGWSGDCVVANATAPDRNLRCAGGQGALAAFTRLPGRDYHLQFDVWTEGVVDATHGKLFLEGPPGDGSNAAFQMIIGCDNLRGAFEYYGNTTRTLLTFPCQNASAHHRVACIWHDQGSTLRCGAATMPDDPIEANFVSIPVVDGAGVPEQLPAIDRVRVLGGIGGRVGTTVFDKIQVLSN